MKKIVGAMLGVLLLSSTAFAVNDLTASAALVIGGGALTAPATGNSNELTIGLSPKVWARYVNEGAAETTAQWYAIATVHPGGNVGYGTAQDVNNIYMKAFVTGDVTTTITNAIPVVKTPVATVDPVTGETSAAATWTALEWSLSAPVQ